MVKKRAYQVKVTKMLPKFIANHFTAVLKPWVQNWINSNLRMANSTKWELNANSN